MKRLMKTLNTDKTGATMFLISTILWTGAGCFLLLQGNWWGLFVIFLATSINVAMASNLDWGKG